MSGPWPEGVDRVPDEPWVREPPGERARAYDAVGDHGWYENLDPTVEAVLDRLGPGDVAVDFSAGTGLLGERLLERGLPRDAGLLNVDASPSFLALAREKLGDHGSMAFRRLRYLEAEDRLQRLEEAVPKALAGSVDGLVSANAVHLYRDLPGTLRSWVRVLAPGAWVHVQSGNVGPAGEGQGSWILDETVEAIAEAAEAVVREDPAFARHREALGDRERMEAHREVRRRFFPPVKDLETYRRLLEEAGLEVEEVRRRQVPVDADEWRSFLSAYDDGFLGWIGGTEHVEGEPPEPRDREDRAEVLARAVDEALEGSGFEATWTYLACRAPG